MSTMFLEDRSVLRKGRMLATRKMIGGAAALDREHRLFRSCKRPRRDRWRAGASGSPRVRSVWHSGQPRRHCARTSHALAAQVDRGTIEERGAVRGCGGLIVAGGKRRCWSLV